MLAEKLPDGPMVSAANWHAGDWGSIPAKAKTFSGEIKNLKINQKI